MEDLQAKLKERKNEAGVQAFGELLMLRRQMLMEELARREDPEGRGVCKEIDKILKNIFD